MINFSKKTDVIQIRNQVKLPLFLDSESLSYIQNDIKMLKEVRDELSRADYFSYKKVIFNGPATIVLWKDGTKTVVKTQNGEPFDAEKGLSMCFMKRALGNKGSFNNVLKKETSQYLEVEQGVQEIINDWRRKWKPLRKITHS